MSLNNFDQMIIADVLHSYDKGAGKIVGVGTIDGARRVILQDFNDNYRYINGKNDVLPIESSQISDFVTVDSTDFQMISNQFGKSRNTYGNSSVNNIINNSVDTRRAINVNRIQMTLITLFLGVFGVHLFIQGKTMMGIIYVICFCCFGISGIFALVDLVRLITLTDAEYQVKYNYTPN